MKLKDKVAIVTGAASGIGRSIAILFAKEGAKVAIADINPEGAEETVQIIEKEKGKAIAITCDVRKEKEVEDMVKKTVKEFGGIDILVNDVGVVSSENITEAKEEQFYYVFDSNIKSMFLFAKHVLPYMLKNGKGKIVNISSTSGIIAPPNMAIYAASKAAVNQFTRVLGLDYAPKNINVNAICPGLTNTPMMAPILKDPNALKGILQHIPRGRATEPEEIAPLALYLASDESDYVCGEIIVIDGGFSLV